MTTEEVREFLNKLHENAEIGRKIANLRPARDVLGRGLQSYAELLQLAIHRAVVQQSIDAVEAQIDDDGFDEATFDQYAWRPAEGSRASAEREALSSAGVLLGAQQFHWHQDYSRTVSVARRLSEALIDNLRSIGLLLQDKEAIRGPMALSRVVLDAAAHVYFLLAPDIEAPERMRRTLNEELGLIVADYKVAMAESDSQAVAAHEAMLAEVRLVAESCDFSDFATMWDQDHQNRVITNVKPYDSTSRMIDLALESPGPFWHELSAIVHSQEGMGIRLLLGLEYTEPSAQRDRNIAFHALPAVLVATRIQPLVASYMAWEFSDLKEPEDLLIELWARGSGHLDSQYRDLLTSEDPENR